MCELVCFRILCGSCPSDFILCVFDMDEFLSDYLGVCVFDKACTCNLIKLAMMICWLLMVF